jgi:hypothetical protein
MTVLAHHRNEPLRRTGVALMWLGMALVIFPAIPADRLTHVHEIVVLWQLTWWMKFAGVTALMLGNTMRLIGVQGHPGLPFPVWPGRVPPEILAHLALRRRAWDNWVAAKAAVAG